MTTPSRIQILRKQRGWTQEQLAQCSGISVRTLQRLENGEPAAGETLQSVAAALGVPVGELLSTPQDVHQTAPAVEAATPPLSAEEAHLQDRVIREARFLRKAINVGATLVLLFIINLVVDPGNWWVIWPALGMGLFLALRAVRLYTEWSDFGPAWQQRRMARLRARS